MSQLADYMLANPTQAQHEAATNLLVETFEALDVAPPATIEDPGAEATKFVSVQGGVAGVPLPVSSVGLDQFNTSSNAALASADGDVATLAAGEILVITNCSADAPLAWKFGTGASTTSFNGVLKACDTTAKNGTGGFIIIDKWIGVVSVAKITGTASYVATKLSKA